MTSFLPPWRQTDDELRYMARESGLPENWYIGGRGASWRDDQAHKRKGLKYSPDQPRVPAGNPDGGEWTDGGGGSGAVADVIPPPPITGVDRDEAARLRAIADADPNVYELANPPKEIEGIPVDRKVMEVRRIAISNIKDRTITINTLNEYNATDQREFARSRFQSGWLSSPHPNHALWHEIGHIRIAEALGLKDGAAAIAQGLREPVFNDYRLLDAAMKVSHYAQTNRAEFLAEVYAGARAGRKFDADVMSRVDDLLDGAKLEGMPT